MIPGRRERCATKLLSVEAVGNFLRRIAALWEGSRQGFRGKFIAEPALILGGHGNRRVHDLSLFWIAIPSLLFKIIVSFETIINYYFGMPDSLPTTEAPLLLQDFLPYRLAVLAKLVGGAFSQAYGERFGISNPQWRVLFALGRKPDCSASHVGQHAALDKVQVSRAVAGLIQMGLVARHTDASDRRNSVLNMTARGRAIYDQIVPEALAFEASLLEGLSGAEVHQLDALLQKLVAKASNL